MSIGLAGWANIIELELFEVDVKLLFKELDAELKLPLPPPPLLPPPLPKIDEEIIFGEDVLRPSDEIGIAGFMKRSLVRRPYRKTRKF